MKSALPIAKRPLHSVRVFCILALYLKIQFELAVDMNRTTTKVPSARALLGESPEKASDRVCRLRLVQGNLVGYGS